MSDRLRKMLQGTGLAESVGERTKGHEVAARIDVSGADITAGRHGMRQCSMVALDRIKPDPDQPRKEFDQVELEQLAASIKERGLLQPIRIRWNQLHGHWIIVAGERRFRAHQMNGAAEIAAVCVEGEMSESDVRVEQIIENALRSDLKPCEQARAFRELMDREGWSGAELARRLNLSRSTVSESLSLLKLDRELQDEVDGGTLGVRDAYVRARGKADAAKKATRKSSKRQRGIELTCRTSSGAKIVATFPRKVSEAEIKAALLEAAGEMARAA